MGRILGLDLGSRRIGVAVSDPSGVLASPHAVIERSASPEVDRDRIRAMVEEVEAEAVVVGMPLSMDGGRGPAAVATEQEITALEAILTVPVESCDERLTTVSAARDLRGLGVKARKQRGVVDQVAAAVMLQAWLDRRRTA